MNQKYSLSLSNKIFLGVMAFITIGLFVWVGHFSSYQMGRLAGTIISLTFFPMLISWVTWKFNKNNKFIPSLTFNIILGLMVIGQIGKFANQAYQNKKLDELKTLSEKFKNNVSNTDNPEEFNASYNKFANSVQNNFEELSKNSSGKEKQGYKIMSEFIATTQTNVKKWNNTFNAINQESFLDFSKMNDAKDFDTRIEKAKEYISETKKYQSYFLSMVTELKKKFKVLGNSQFAREAIAGATNKYNAQKPIFDPLMKSHIEYGKTFIQLLAFLKDNQDKWFHQDEQMNFTEDKPLNQFNATVAKLVKHEESINSLSQKLLKKI